MINSKIRKKALIVDDDQMIHFAVKQVLKEKFDCMSAFHGDEAQAILKNQQFDVVLIDLNMRWPEEGLQYLPKLKAINPDLDIIVVSSNRELDLASRCISAGASAYLTKEHSPDQLLITVESIVQRRELLRVNAHYVSDRKRVLEKNQIIGNSAALKKLLRDIEKIKRANVNVLILGETGTGKELVARHIAGCSDKPFVPVDSATITSSMAESILFGHERGAFTGAQSKVVGLFEEAHGGAIYFDEVGNMPLDIQSKLLRVIQEKEVRRLGSARALPLDFRVICATNQDLDKMVEEKTFKEDLLQRLNVISIRIPPLRERRDDIELLLKHYFEKSKITPNQKGFSEESLEFLKKYHWPGNIRELANLVANLCIMSQDDDWIEPDQLPQRVIDFSVSQKRSQVLVEGVLAECQASDAGYFKVMANLEKEVLEQMYRRYGKNLSEMSRCLKISRSHLYTKLAEHNLH